MPTDLDAQLAKLRALLELEEKATPGPWVPAAGAPADELLIAALRNDAPAAIRALLAVADEHVEGSGDFGSGYCYECGKAWPCRTERIITAALAGSLPAQEESDGTE